jgi:hypothetical protein
MLAILEVKTQLGRQNRWMSLRHWRAPALGLLCQLQWGCYYHDQEGQSGPFSPNEPHVLAFEYRVSNVTSGATYATGCAETGTRYDLSNAASAHVPLGTEYLFEQTSFRSQAGSLSEHDAGYFCQLPYQIAPMDHLNPLCFRTLGDAGSSDLIEASVVDANGNPVTSDIGSNTDIERYRLRSHDYGTVELSQSGPPCNGPEATSIRLLTILPP